MHSWKTRGNRDWHEFLFRKLANLSLWSLKGNCAFITAIFKEMVYLFFYTRQTVVVRGAKIFSPGIIMIIDFNSYVHRTIRIVKKLACVLYHVYSSDLAVKPQFRRSYFDRLRLFLSTPPLPSKPPTSPRSVADEIWSFVRFKGEITVLLIAYSTPGGTVVSNPLFILIHCTLIALIAIYAQICWISHVKIESC